MFDDDINKLAEFVAVESVVDTTLVLDKLKKIAVMQNGHIFSKDLPFAKFREQLISLERLEGILLDEGLSAAFNKYLRSDRTWADRVEVFNDVVRSRGENVADGIESNPKVIERMRKRENPRHPAVSLGIAKTNGYEVEYDSIKNPVVQRLKKNNTFDYLYTLGFKCGTGDMNSGKADETSPGPFYDPQTAAIVYLLYANAKIIDTSMFVGSTFHFNIDNSVDDDDIVPIIRGLYLTGAALSPYHDSERDTLATVNHKDERRTEGKVFGVNTDADFVWTMISAANLCFAKAASKDESDSPGKEYRDALGQIWEEYVQRMEKGLEYVNKKGYLYERRLRVVTQDEVGHKFLTPEPNEEWVKDQLKKVFTDRTYAAYPDLKRAGQQNPAQQTGDGVRGIFEEPSKWYPNIAVFSRTVINEAVSGVQKVIRKIETDCLQDIREIDSLQDEEKWAKLYNFVHKYNVDIGRENPLHPLVSTGIARKTGWEIEFNCKTPSVQIFLRNDLRTALGIIGFKPGTGDMIKNFDDKTADEASPGPFYDPLTSMVTYAMYVDAGLINTKEFIASTCHFNASVVSIRSMVPIIRTLQLTGAGFYPHKLSGRPEMSVDANGPINDRYIESKAFSVNTDADTLWNLKSAAFLTWAAGVGEDGFDNKPGAMFRKEMDEIWTDYIFDFRDGLKSVGRSNLVYTKRNFEVTLGEREHVPDVLWLHKQLAMIYSDLTYATTPDLTKVGPATPEEMTEDGIQGIMFKGVWYPNVALFARTVVNRAVSKIEKIGQRVEENWEKDVKRIEGLHGSKRRRAVRRFLNFYGYNKQLPKYATVEDMEAMFVKVGDFMNDE